MAGAYGQKLGEFVGVSAPPAIKAKLLQTADFATTHLSWDQLSSEVATRIGMEDAYLVFLQRRPIPANPYWIDGRSIEMQPLDRGQSLLLDLREEHRSVVSAAVDCIAFYVPRSAIDRVADEQQSRRPAALRTSYGNPVDDKVIWHIGEALFPMIHQPCDLNRLAVDSLSLALTAHLTMSYGEFDAGFLPRTGVLASWQERRCKELMMDQLTDGISLEQLASECRLSRSHFARAFKATTGVPAHRWLLERRLDRARRLLLTTDLTLDDIAAEAGFADQSHFSRTFSRAMGSTPGRWRRARRLGAAWERNQARADHSSRP